MPSPNPEATAQFFAIKSDPADGGHKDGIQQLLAGLLKSNVVEGVLVPTRQSHQKVVMPTLIADPSLLDAIDPLAPVVTSTAAKVVSSLTFKAHGRPVAALLRSCELRAFTELVKLNQGSFDDLVVISFDCLGRYENSDYLALAQEYDDLSSVFIKSALAGDTVVDGKEVATACRACEYVVPEPVDLRVCLLGAEQTQLLVEAASDRGKAAMGQLAGNLTSGVTVEEVTPPADRKAALAALEKKRVAFRDELFADFTERTKDLDGLMEATAGCINCYNCRVACPVCYCRQCVFVTDTFRHDSDQYVKWAVKRGQVKMPTDTVMYHLTRMVHMSTLCVGCGQCTSACPNDIPVMELFRTVACHAQSRFEYVPGRDPEEPQPLATFYDGELPEVTGQSK